MLSVVDVGQVGYGTYCGARPGGCDSLLAVFTCSSPGEVFFLCMCVLWDESQREGERGRGSRWHVAEVVGGREGVPPRGQPAVPTPCPLTHTQACRGGSARRAMSARPGPRVFVLVFVLQDVCFAAAKSETQRHYQTWRGQLTTFSRRRSPPPPKRILNWVSEDNYVGRSNGHEDVQSYRIHLQQ